MEVLETSIIQLKSDHISAVVILFALRVSPHPPNFEFVHHCKTIEHFAKYVSVCQNSQVMEIDYGE